jgi:hypothetical protein
MKEGPKMKQILIVNCLTCPFHTCGSTNHPDDRGFCFYKGRARDLWGIDINETPDFCPLPDASCSNESKGGERTMKCLPCGEAFMGDNLDLICVDCAYRFSPSAIDRLAIKIFSELKKNGAGIGTASISIIKSILCEWDASEPQEGHDDGMATD